MVKAKAAGRGAGGSSGSSIGSIPISFSTGLIAAIAIAIFGLYAAHVESMFENERFFSALTDLEREMAFRSEQALYYSYYKDMIRDIEAGPSFIQGFATGFGNLVNNQVTEYPESINIVQRFNIYPEVVLAVMYEAYNGVASRLGMSKSLKQCYHVMQGEGKNAVRVTTCVGMGVPMHFYVRVSFLLQGLIGAGIFIISWKLSGSIPCALLSIVALFFNFTEFTRAQWTPSLRESFAFPFLTLQILSVVHAIKTTNFDRAAWLGVFITTVCFALPWQFANFALFTQASSLFAVYLLDYIPAKRLSSILTAKLAAMAVVWWLQFGSIFLLLSFFFAFSVVVLGLLRLDDSFRKLDQYSAWLRRVLVGGLAVALTVGFKFAWGKILNNKDDAHILDILRAKFDSSFIDFHVQLYVCAVEFDFLREEYFTLSETLLMPVAFVTLPILALKMCKDTGLWLSRGAKTAEDKLPSEVAYIAVQTVWFTFMAVLIMRLKLFMVLAFFFLTALSLSEPFLQIASNLLHFKIPTRKTRFILMGVLLFGMAVRGVPNLIKWRTHMGEFSDPDLGDMLKFIEKDLPADAAFVGSMPVTSNIKCSTNRPIVNHPHYEDVGIRNRTFHIYKTYARFPEEVVHQVMQDYKADYLFLDTYRCRAHDNPKCDQRTIYGMYYPEYAEVTPFCELWMSDSHSSQYFTPIYRNSRFTILKVEPL